MTTTELFQRTYISPPISAAVSTYADTESPANRGASNSVEREALQARWGEIESRLIQWGCDPSDLEEEGMQVPTRDTIRRATQLALQLCKEGAVVPTNVTTGVRGDVVFEWRIGDAFHSAHIRADKTLEMRTFEGGRLKVRQTVDY